MEKCGPSALYANSGDMCKSSRPVSTKQLEDLVELAAAVEKESYNLLGLLNQKMETAFGESIRNGCDKDDVKGRGNAYVPDVKESLKTILHNLNICINGVDALM